MEKLIATYKLELPFNFIAQRSREENAVYRLTLDKFDIILTLICTEPSNATKMGEDTYYTFPISDIDRKSVV